MRLVTFALLAVVPLLPARGQSAGSSTAALRQAVVAARLRLDSALAARDTAAIAGLLADDAILVGRADTLRGRAAVAAFVAAGIAPIPEVRLNYAPERMVECTPTMLDERNGAYILFLSTYAGTDTLRGSYAARWVAAGDGTARLATLLLGSPTARPRLGTCQVVPMAAIARQRVQIFLPTPFATGGWNTVGSIEETLRARGYASGRLSERLDGEVTFATREDGTPVTIGARVRMRGAWSVEAYMGVDAKVAEIRGYRQADSSYVIARYNGRHGAVLVGYERGFARVAVGPAILRNSWGIDELEVHATLDTAGNVSGWQSGGVRGSSAYREWQVGVVGETAVVFPVSRFVFIEARAAARRFGERATRAAGRFAPASADHSGYTFSLGIGGAL